MGSWYEREKVILLIFIIFLWGQESKRNTLKFCPNFRVKPNEYPSLCTILKRGKIIKNAKIKFLLRISTLNY